MSGKHLDGDRQRRIQRKCMCRLRARRRRELALKEAEYQRWLDLEALAPELFPISTALQCVLAGELYGYAVG